MEKWPLTALADGLLRDALSATSGRSTCTVHGGHPHLLCQTVIALVTGQTLDEPENPGEATVQVLRGRIRLAAGAMTSDGSAGELLIVPAARHAVTALTDAVVLLSVVERPPPMAADPGG
jgi:quercetin dioxygenase-like cupin family protein